MLATKFHTHTEQRTSYQYTTLIKKIQIIVTPHFPMYSTVNTSHDFPSFPAQCLLRADKFTKWWWSSLQICRWMTPIYVKKAEIPWSNLIHIIELSTSLKRHYWVSNGRTNWVRTLVPVRPWACSVPTAHRNSHLRVLIQLSAQIHPIRTVSSTP